MNDVNTMFEELRLSQARRRGFESHHPLHYQKDVSSNLDLPLGELLLFFLDEKGRVDDELFNEINYLCYFTCSRREELV